jgi:hypothetical protein
MKAPGRRALPGLVLTVAAAGLAAAACGPGAVLTADTPDQAVSAALQSAQTTPLRMSLSGDLTLDTAGLANLPASIQTAINQIGTGGSATGQLTQESSARRQLTVSADGSTLTFVEYDGHGYVSQGGGSFAELSTTLPTAAAVGSSDLSTAVSDLSFADEGPATVDGVAAEHYSASITVSTLEKLVQDLGGSSGESADLGPALALLAPYVSGSGTADLWLSAANGSLVRAALSGSLTVAVGSAASALAGLGMLPASAGSLPTGSLGLSLSLTADVSDFGGSVSVTEPDATSTLPAPTGWAGWLMSPSAAPSA